MEKVTSLKNHCKDLQIFLVIILLFWMKIFFRHRVGIWTDNPRWIPSIWLSGSPIFKNEYFRICVVRATNGIWKKISMQLCKNVENGKIICWNEEVCVHQPLCSRRTQRHTGDKSSHGWSQSSFGAQRASYSICKKSSFVKGKSTAAWRPSLVLFFKNYVLLDTDVSHEGLWMWDIRSVRRWLQSNNFTRKSGVATVTSGKFYLMSYFIECKPI
jgi:hypothetical protein